MPDLSEKRILIIGCGYVGAEAAQLFLNRGATVMGWVRSAETAAQLDERFDTPAFRSFMGDAASREDWARLVQGATEPFDLTIHCVSSGRGGADSYRLAYLESLRCALQSGLAKSHAQVPGLIFVSSSSVYAQTSGETVTEKSPAQPQRETGQILRQAEEETLSHHGIVLRVTGIYGPGRGYLLRQHRAGEAFIPGNGRRTINQVHRDDVASAIIHAATHGSPGHIYNVADDEPTNYLEFFRWTSATLNLPFPQRGPVDANRKRGVTNKRVSNAKLRALGWTPHYPTFRDGYTALLKTAAQADS